MYASLLANGLHPAQHQLLTPVVSTGADCSFMWLIRRSWILLQTEWGWGVGGVEIHFLVQGSSNKGRKREAYLIRTRPLNRNADTVIKF